MLRSRFKSTNSCELSSYWFSVPLTLLFFSSANKQIGRGSGIVNTWYMTDGMRHLFGTEYRNLVLTKVGLLLTC